MARFEIFENDWYGEYLIDTEHEAYDPDYPRDSDDAIVCYISYDCPEDNNFFRSLSNLPFMLNEMDAEIKRLKEGNG